MSYCPLTIAHLEERLEKSEAEATEMRKDKKSLQDRNHDASFRLASLESHIRDMKVAIAILKSVKFVNMLTIEQFAETLEKHGVNVIKAGDDG